MWDTFQIWVRKKMVLWNQFNLLKENDKIPEYFSLPVYSSGMVMNWLLHMLNMFDIEAWWYMC